MTVLLDAEITGNGQYNFGGNQVQYVLVSLDVLGPQVFVADLGNPDMLGQAGWFALGSRSLFQAETEQPFWTERHWINWQRFQWHPEPTVQAFTTGDLCVWASDIRWHLSPDTHGYLLVIGI